ncbi:MAG TPA: hypothetical protein DEP66_02925 [Acidimicrobiaceae bacterium]|nr:hypothetical protein [Acidimicrobiaceae bacterium]HCB37174.1 hypothetical protein [Acidimicrobiaceae bacterium]
MRERRQLSKDEKQVLEDLKSDTSPLKKQIHVFRGILEPLRNDDDDSAATKGDVLHPLTYQSTSTAPTVALVFAQEIDKSSWPRNLSRSGDPSEPIKAIIEIEVHEGVLAIVTNVLEREILIAPKQPMRILDYAQNRQVGDFTIDHYYQAEAMPR